MSYYDTPAEHYYRIHHCRPRFKRNLENVLGWMAISSVGIGRLRTSEFNYEFDDSIRAFEDNAIKKDKTIANWRTEISALFGLINWENGITYPTKISHELARELNLEKFFRRFIATFQYPGGHLKSHEILDMVNQGIKFHPCRWLAVYFMKKEKEESKKQYVTAEEFCHCVLNDKRVTVQGESINKTYERIQNNRKKERQYDSRSDTIRYARDILDYMVYAHLLKKDLYRRYRVRKCAWTVLKNLARSKNFFKLYQNCSSTGEIASFRSKWVDYVNSRSDYLAKGPPVFAYIIEEEKPEELYKAIGKKVDTKTIGDLGEAKILIHEKLRIENEGRSDLKHRITLIPDKLAAGYDINSIEVDETKRYVEVKTSISIKELTFNRFKLTPNEWTTAESLRKLYYVYRLQITEDKGNRLFIINNPVGEYKKDRLKMVPRDGADIYFDETCGEYVDLLE